MNTMIVWTREKKWNLNMISREMPTLAGLEAETRQIRHIPMFTMDPTINPSIAPSPVLLAIISIAKRKKEEGRGACGGFNHLNFDRDGHPIAKVRQSILQIFISTSKHIVL